MMTYQKNIMKFWKKIKNNLQKEFDNEPASNEKYLNANVKSYNWKINTNNKIPKADFHRICLSII